MDIDLLQPLNNEQWKAVTYTEGPLLILAGAGSKPGLCMVDCIPIKKRACTLKHTYTFINKADEMKERINSLVGGKNHVDKHFHSHA